MRENFKGPFLRSVISKHGCFVHVPTGRAQDRAPPAVPVCHWDGPEVLIAPSTPVISEVVCPVVAYQQGGADLCVAYWLASAVRHLGDRSAAATIAACAAAAATSCDAIGYVRDVVNADVAGWGVRPLHDHDPLQAHAAEPTLLQLVGSDGAGTHAVTTLGDLIFDSAEVHVLPLTRASLDRCVGSHLNGATFSHVGRAVRRCRANACASGCDGSRQTDCSVCCPIYLYA